MICLFVTLFFYLLILLIPLVWNVHLSFIAYGFRGKIAYNNKRSMNLI